MATQIILLSGPVASGKSTLCRSLERHFDMKAVQTRELITRNLDRNRQAGREGLQWEGERLDRLTGGAWVSDELQRVLIQGGAESALIVDAVRTLDQVRIIRNTLKSAVRHIHLTASERTLSERYVGRSPRRDQSQLPEYAYVRENETERLVDTLRDDADIVINTGLHDELETFRLARAFLLHVGNACTSC